MQVISRPFDIVPFGGASMCNLYNVSTNQEAIRVHRWISNSGFVPWRPPRYVCDRPFENDRAKIGADEEAMRKKAA